MKRIFSATLLFCICTASWAASNQSLSNPNNGQFFVSAAGGYMFDSVQGDNHLNAGAGWPNDHYSVTGMSDQPYLFVGGGYQWNRDDTTWLPDYSFGIRFLYMSAATVSGYIDQYSMPEFRNYNYTYDTAIMNLMAVFKLGLVRWNNIVPFIMLGAGRCKPHDFEL